MLRSILACAAISIYIPLLAQTDSATYFLQKGIEEKTKGHRPEALRNFEKAYTYDANSKEVLYELAASYLEVKHYTQAKEKFSQLEKLGERSDSVYKQLLLLSFTLRQFDDVIKYASSLAKINTSFKTSFYVGKAYYEKEDLGNAIKYLSIACKEDPQNADAPYMVARSYTDMQNYMAAIPYFQKAIQVNPNQANWIYEMALVYYALNDDQNALKYMLQAGEKGVKRDNAYMQNLATAFLNAGRFTEGITTLKEILQMRPDDKNVLSTLAEAYYNAQKYDDAIAYYDELLRMDKQNAEALYMIGMSFQKKGDKEKGMALCDKAIQLDPGLRNLRQEKRIPM